MKTTIQNPTEADRVTRARIALLITFPWFGQLALNLKVTEDPSKTTMATDGTRLYYNPTWTAEQADAVLAGTIAHEALHCGLRHMFRCQGRDLALWNRATDEAINRLLLASGLQLPADILNDPSYDGLAAETIYAKLLHDQQERQRQQEEQDQQEQDNAEKRSQEQEQTAEDQNQPDGEEAAGDNGGDADSQNQADSTANTGPDRADAVGNQAASGPDDLIPAPTAAQAEAAGDEPPLSEVEWEIVTEQATMVANKRGLMPGDAARAVDETLAPKVDWRTVLRQFVEQTMPSDYSWSIPNRRYIAQGLYLPSVVKENTPRLVVALDTSGSIDQRSLDTFASELTAIMLEARPSAIDVVSCDAHVQNVETFTPDDGEIVPHPVGGGGTAFQPLFDWIEEQDEPPAAIIYLTDLDGDEPTDPGIPVLWITPEHITAEGRFGETIRIPATRDRS